MEKRSVAGGVLVDGDSLCDTCRHARNIQGYAESERIVICDRYWEPMRVPFRVRECSGYDDKRMPQLDDMEEIALILKSKQPGRSAGFSGTGLCATAEENEEEDDDKVARRKR